MAHCRTENCVSEEQTALTSPGAGCPWDWGRPACCSPVDLKWGSPSPYSIFPATERVQHQFSRAWARGGRDPSSLSPPFPPLLWQLSGGACQHDGQQFIILSIAGCFSRGFWALHWIHLSRAPRADFRLLLSQVLAAVKQPSQH